jgi:hypothetical protein
MTDPICDVRREQYPTVIRDMIRHENDLTNHRIMWLLVGQGFIANAYVSVKADGLSANVFLAPVGILVSFSAFVMLYRSYQPRGYLQFLGHQAKQGILREEDLPLTGWPGIRIEGWWSDSWVCPWFRHIRDLLEPWLLLPFLFTTMWMTSLLHGRSSMNTIVSVAAGIALSAVVLCVTCSALVWRESKDDIRIER